MDFNKINKIVLEPRVFSLLLRTESGVFLYNGVHFTLEEAFHVGKAKMLDSLPSEVGKNENIDIELWNSIGAREVLVGITNPAYVTIEDLERSGYLDGKNSKSIDIPDGGRITGNEIKELIGEDIDDSEAEEIAQKIENIFSSIEKPKIKKEIPNKIIKENQKKNSKNELIKKLIIDGDINEVEGINSLLTKHEKKYIIDEINKKKPPNEQNKPSKDKKNKNNQ